MEGANDHKENGELSGLSCSYTSKRVEGRFTTSVNVHGEISATNSVDVYDRVNGLLVVELNQD